MNIIKLDLQIHIAMLINIFRAVLYYISQHFICWDYVGMTIQDPKIVGMDPNSLHPKPRPIDLKPGTKRSSCVSNKMFTLTIISFYGNFHFSTLVTNHLSKQNPTFHKCYTTQFIIYNFGDFGNFNN